MKYSPRGVGARPLSSGVRAIMATPDVTDRATPEGAEEAFRAETLRFLRAQNIFLIAENLALTGNDKLRERINDFDELVKPEYEDGFHYLLARLFIAYISSFEVFLQEIATHVIRAHPKKVGSSQFKLEDLLNASSADELIERAIEEHMNRLMYKRPMEYLSEYCDLISIDRLSLEKLWPTFVEAKARRDLGVHANWRCNTTYLRKVKEAGVTPSGRIGDFLAPKFGKYLDEVSDAMLEMAEIIVDSVDDKFDLS
jgi:hypothetical protein